MIDTSQKLLEYGKAAGAEEVEVYCVKSTVHEIRTSRMKLEAIKQATTSGVAVRVICGKKLGLAHSSDLSDSALRLTSARAVELARGATADEYQDFALQARTYPKLSLLDERLARTSLEEKTETILSVEKAAFAYDKRIIGSDYVSYNDETREILIMNSKGLRVGYVESSVSIGGAFVAEEDGSKQMGWDWQIERSFERLNPSRVGARAAERAVLTLKGKPVKSGTYPVVLQPLVGMKLISGIAQAVDGESVRLGRSFLADRKGEEVASSIVTIVDDGTRADWVGSSPADDEGSPTAVKEIVKDGVLMGFLYDLYTARRVGVKTTGNGRRPSYKVGPAIAPTNFFLHPGRSTEAEMIKEIPEGLLVMGSLGFSGNPITGDFSIGVSGRWIHGGTLAQPVCGVTIASNMSEMLKAVDAIGDDLVAVEGGIGIPTIRLKSITVAGL